MLKSKITPDPIRDAPVGEHQAPGPHIVLPARAFGDTRFNQFPTTFRVLALCAAHASARGGIFFCNQSLIASIIESSQQAVSQHMVKLVKFGYIEKVRREDKRRNYGKQGAKWRMIYDPRMNMAQAIANSTEGDDTVAIETLNKIKPLETKTTRPLTDKQIKYAEQITEKLLKDEQQYFPFDSVLKDVKKFLATSQTEQDWIALGNGLDSPIIKGIMKPKVHKPHLVKEEKYHKPDLVNHEHKNKPQLVKYHKAQLVDNTSNLTINNNINNIEKKKICNAYMNIVKANYGTNWSYDFRQMELAGDLLNCGYTLETFEKDATSVVEWNRNNNKTPPQSLGWFIARKKNKNKPMDVQDIIKKTARSLQNV